MFKVADYLIQAQSPVTHDDFAELRPLDTRGGSSAVFSIWVLGSALAKLVQGRFGGRLAGVHVNMAERLSLFRKGLVVVVAHTLGLPVVLHLHAAQLQQFYRDLPRPLRALTRWMFSLPAACIVLGAEGKRFVTQELAVPPDRVEIVINGVPEPTVARRRAGESGTQRVLFLGNLSERKGISDLLRALALPGFNRRGLAVNIAGGGDISGYQGQATRLGIDDFVKFEGWVDQDKAAHLLAGADVLTLPSYDEGLPLVILEALANAVAVVCTPVGEIPGVLTDGVDVCFVQPGDASSIAAGLQRVLDNPVLRETLERNGRLVFERQFSLAGFFDSVARIHRRHFGICGQPRASQVPALRSIR
jgi:glycosyltransferase involved in cell wall biosynthesis